MKFDLIAIYFLAILTGCFMSVGFAFASITDGTIDSSYKYAWSENAGWLNFGTAEGNVHITDSALTGYVWGENIGWISLNCSNDLSCGTVDYKVANDGEGNLSGYAWSENSGWISFNPSYGGISVNSSGEFVGYAWGENIGWIVFNCVTTNSCLANGGVDFKVKTDWRARSLRSECNNALDDDGDGLIDYPSDTGCDSLDDDREFNEGGGLPVGAYSAPVSYETGFGVVINNNDVYADSRDVVLSLRGGPNVERMAVSNFADFRNAAQEPFQPAKNWTLTEGEGEKIVYVKFFTSYGQTSEVVFDKIIYVKELPMVSPPSPEDASRLPLPEESKKEPLIGRLIEKLKPFIPDFLKPKEEEEAPPIDIAELASREAPLVFRGEWNLMPAWEIKRFVFAPLPREIDRLVEKFPELKKTFGQIGVSRMADLVRLERMKLSLPGMAKIGEIPSEVIFAGSRENLIDFNAFLTLNEQGKPRQQIRTVAGKMLTLTVKPEMPAESIRGYLVFKSKKITESFLKIPFRHLAASLILGEAALAEQQEVPLDIERELLLLEFEYFDSDNDGIYTAEIQAPVTEGEYEIITIINYQDPELGAKAIRMITIVDPEGYVFEKDKGREIRIPGAIVSLYWLNPETKNYQLWPAADFQQENPQVTDVTGRYSFLAPEGDYYLKVEAPGYLAYEGKPFQVKVGSGIHANIELKTKYWWLKAADWKDILLIFVILLLLYNFYKDKIREKLNR